MAQPPYVVIPIEPTFRITDWNGRAIEAAQSRGNVVAVADFSDNLMRLESALWPTAAVLQKLCRNPRHEEAFDGQARQLLTERLGFYSDLQSLHSEDAITWSFFGTLSMASPVKRTAFCGSNYRRTKKIARLNSGAVFRFVVVNVVWHSPFVTDSPCNAPITMRTIAWSDLASWSEHPNTTEFRLYYEWKQRWSKK